MNPISITDDNIAFTTKQSLFNPHAITITAHSIGLESIDQSNLAQFKQSGPLGTAADLLLGKCCMIPACSIGPLIGGALTAIGYFSNNLSFTIAGVSVLIGSLVAFLFGVVLYIQGKCGMSDFIANQKAGLLPRAKVEAQKRIAGICNDASTTDAPQNLLPSETTLLLHV